MREWFAVDKEGLAKALARRGIAFAVGELLQNAMDADDVTSIHVSLIPIPHAPTARLIVEDDSPKGFVDLRHAWVLFGGSTKTKDPTKSGKYDLGDKLVFALSREASVVTTTGSVRFDAKGRHRSAEKRERGSRVEALLPMTRADLDRCIEFVQRVLPRPGLQIEFTAPDGTTTVIPHREPLAAAKATLETEIGDDFGRLQRVYRTTTIDVHPAPPGGRGFLYELGLPVCETNDPYSYNINQRVPVGWDRDAVTLWYLGSVRVAVLNVMADRIEDPNAEWVTNALERSDVTSEAVRGVIQKRFGPLAVAADPTDHEAEGLATSHGYTVVAGGSLSAAAWDNVRKADALPRAGRVFPSKLPTSSPPDEIIQPENQTPGMKRIVRYARRLGEALLGFEPAVSIVRHASGGNAAQWDANAKSLLFNVSRLPDEDRWFGDGYDVPDRVVEILLHEFAHHGQDGTLVANHLSHEYHENLCRLGAQIRRLGHLDYEN